MGLSRVELNDRTLYTYATAKTILVPAPCDDPQGYMYVRATFCSDGVYRQVIEPTQTPGPDDE